MADVRDGLAKGLEGKLDEEQIKTLMDEVLAINKSVHTDFTCKECGKRQRQPALVPDARAVTSALTELMNQSWGRPGDSKVETEIVVNRNVYLVSEDEDADSIDIPGE
jgi:hypothetical protein